MPIIPLPREFNDKFFDIQTLGMRVQNAIARVEASAKAAIEGHDRDDFHRQQRRMAKVLTTFDYVQYQLQRLAYEAEVFRHEWLEAEMRRPAIPLGGGGSDPFLN